MKVVMASGLGYVDHEEKVLDADTNQKYAYVMTGSAFGDQTTAGAYAGVASYLNTGAVDITTNSNSVYAAVDPANAARKTRGSSTKGAPAGPYKVCITDAAGGKCSEAERIFKPSEYKFSIFGVLQGSEYDAKGRSMFVFEKREPFSALCSSCFLCALICFDIIHFFSRGGTKWIPSGHGPSRFPNEIVDCWF